MPMNFGSKGHMILRKGPPIVGALVGITTTLNVASAKQGPLPFSSKAFVILARIIGGQNAYMLLGGNSPGSLANSIPFVQGGGSLTNITAGIQPFGAINQTTVSGFVILLVNWAVKQVIGGKYGYHYIAPFINAVGVGTVAGGIVGGLLDPPAGGSGGSSRSSSISGISLGGPSGYAHSSQIGVFQ